MSRTSQTAIDPLIGEHDIQPTSPPFIIPSQPSFYTPRRIVLLLLCAFLIAICAATISMTPGAPRYVPSIPFIPSQRYTVQLNISSPDLPLSFSQIILASVDTPNGIAKLQYFDDFGTFIYSSKASGTDFYILPVYNTLKCFISNHQAEITLPRVFPVLYYEHKDELRPGTITTPLFTRQVKTMFVNGQECHVWRHTATSSPQDSAGFIGEYTFYVNAINGTPVRFEQRGDSMLFHGGHLEHWVVDYHDLRSVSRFPSSTFQIPAAMPCVSEDILFQQHRISLQASLNSSNPLLSLENLVSSHTTLPITPNTIPTPPFTDSCTQYVPHVDPANPIPEEFSWLNNDVIKTLFDPTIEKRLTSQLSCRSSAFRSLAQVMTAKYYLQYPSNLDLFNPKVVSAQSLIDCVTTPGNLGCRGGKDYSIASWLLQRNYGYAAEDVSYGGFRNTNSFCHYSVADDTVDDTNPFTGEHVNALTRLISCEHVGDQWNSDIPQDIDKLIDDAKNALFYHGPLVISIYPSSLYYYTSGVFHEFDCKSLREELTHSAVLLGWTKDAFIIHPGWGKDWGEDGIGYISTRGNICGVATMPLLVETTKV